MPSVVDHLASVPFLRNVPSEELRRVAPSFTEQKLRAGEGLWQHGEAVADLGLLVQGALVATSAGREVGRVRAPDLVGEASAFFASATRTATLTAETASTVLLLTTPELRSLRFQRSPVYEVLLDHALRALVRRVAATGREIGKHAVGGEERVERKETGTLAKLWRSFRAEKPGPCPPLAPLLRSMPGLSDMDTELEAGLVAQFEARSFAEGEVVVLEGEASDAMYVVADGEIDVLRNVRGDRAELLTKLRSGQTFGANTTIENGPRTASCVGIKPGWLYRMDKSAYEKLRGDVRLRWQECILATLASQIRNANGALAKALLTQGLASGQARLAAAAKSEGPKPGIRPTPSGLDTAKTVPGASGISAADLAARRETEQARFAELLKASGFLESLPTDEFDLERLDVSYDEATKRRTRR